jgi:hypothetical protein
VERNLRAPGGEGGAGVRYIIRDDGHAEASLQLLSWKYFYFQLRKDGAAWGWTEYRDLASKLSREEAREWLPKVRADSPTAKVLQRKFECSKKDCSHDFDDCPTCGLCGMDALEYEQKIMGERDQALRDANKFRALYAAAWVRLATARGELSDEDSNYASRQQIFRKTSMGDPPDEADKDKAYAELKKGDP